MKRLLSVLIVLAMALTGFALAEAAKGAAEPVTEPPAVSSRKQRLRSLK